MSKYLENTLSSEVSTRTTTPYFVLKMWNEKFGVPKTSYDCLAKVQSNQGFISRDYKGGPKPSAINFPNNYDAKPCFE